MLSRRTCSILPTGAILPFTIFAALCACADSYADVEDDAEEELAIEEDVEAWTPRFGESSYRSPGCNNPLALNAGTYDTSLTVSDGPSPRNYRVILRSGYNRNTPHALMFFMHSCEGDHRHAHSTVAQSMQAAGIPTITVGPSSAVADERGNQDAQGTDGQKCWNLNLDWYDVKFVEELLDYVLDNYCIDTRNIFFNGGSSGSFGAQGIGCHTQATAITGDRGGIHHPNAQFPNFPETAAPSDGACEPIPALLGFARQDNAVPYDIFAPVSREFWRRNNQCGTTSSRDTTTEAQVCTSSHTNCRCERYSGCAAPFVMCSWDGGHDVSGIGATASAWWFSQFIDGGVSTPPPNPPQTCTPSAQNFVADIRVDPSHFPLTPFCDRCRSVGVAGGNGQRAEFMVRWSNGFDPQAGADTNTQWIEERPTMTPRPYLRIEGTASELRFSSSTDGVTWRSDLTTTNALSGTIAWTSSTPDATVVSRTLSCP